MDPRQELEELEAIIDRILAGIQDALQNGEVLSDEFQQILADELAQTYDRITELNEQIQQEPQGAPPIPEPPQQPEAQPIPPREPFQGPQGGAPPIQGLGPPPSPEAQLLWILAGQREDYFVDYLHNYPSQNTAQLLSNPAELERVVQYLHAMMPSGQPPSIGGIPHAELNSSNIYGFRYNPNTQKMKVRFQNGSVYEYSNVPPQVFSMFQAGAIPAKTTGQNQYGRWWRGKVPSLGSSFFELIKRGGYSYNRLR